MIFWWKMLEIGKQFEVHRLIWPRFSQCNEGCERSNKRFTVAFYYPLDRRRIELSRVEEIFPCVLPEVDMHDFQCPANYASLTYKKSQFHHYAENICSIPPFGQGSLMLNRLFFLTARSQNFLIFFRILP